MVRRSDNRKDASGARTWIKQLHYAVPGSLIPPDMPPADPPEHRLLLAAGLLIVFPQSDWFIDLTAVIGFPFWLSYLGWIALDLLIVATLFVSVRMFQRARRFVLLTLSVDALLAVLYWAFYVAEVIDRPVFVPINSALALASLAIISWAMWERVDHSPDLFRQAAPLLVAIFFSFAAGGVGFAVQCANGACPHRTSAEQIPDVGLNFFEIAAQVIAALLIALAVEARSVARAGVKRGQGEQALLAVSVLTFAVGAGAALTALATQRDDLPLAFELSVQAIALGFAAIFTLTLAERDQRPTRDWTTRAWR